jgi:hypothetical protein
MAVKPLLIIVVAAAMMAVAAVALVRPISGRRGLPDARGLLWQLTGLVVGFSLCAVVGLLDGPRYRLILSLPALAGICWLLGLVAAERTRPRGQNGSIRLAGLVPRTPGRYAARWAYVSMRTAFLLAAVLALAASALGSPTDSTQVSATAMDGFTTSYGPWPGWYYSVPALIGLACGWAMTEWAIRTVVRRPPVATDPDADGRTRAQSARVALTAACLMALPVVGALLLTMGAGLAHVSPSASVHAIAWAMEVCGSVVLLASAAAWLSALVSGGRAVVPRVVEP